MKSPHHYREFNRSHIVLFRGPSDYWTLISKQGLVAAARQTPVILVSRAAAFRPVDHVEISTRAVKENEVFCWTTVAGPAICTHISWSMVKLAAFPKVVI
jgi:hypothetical protein